MKKLLILAVILGGLFYLNTAVIKGLGGPGENLVVKPLHGICPFYGGGEENSWIRAHSGEALPWWHYPNKDYTASLIQTSSENSVPLWLILYSAGYYLWILTGISLAAFVIYQKIKGEAEPCVPANPLQH